MPTNAVRARGCGTDRLTRRVVALLVLIAAVGAPSAPAAPATQPAATQPAKHVKLLAIGNSFSGNATKFLPDIVKASGNALTFGHASIGGCSLKRHWGHAEAFEANPDDPNGRPYTGPDKKKVSLRELLTKEPWDYVTIQQFSFESHNIDTYRPYAGLLAAYVRKHAPTAKLLVHETWAYRADDPRFKRGMTQQQMYDGLRRAYATIAGEIGAAGVLPVGDAFWRAQRDPAWQFAGPDPNFDYAKPQPPKLPDQTHSLHVGHTWKDVKGKQSLAMDGHHANAAGQYLGAAVWFEVLYGQSVVGNAFVPKGVKPADVAFLQRVAHETVQKPDCVPAANAERPAAAATRVGADAR